jgi:hypothetical protein
MDLHSHRTGPFRGPHAEGVVIHLDIPELECPEELADPETGQPPCEFRRVKPAMAAQSRSTGEEVVHRQSNAKQCPGTPSDPPHREEQWDRTAEVRGLAEPPRSLAQGLPHEAKGTVFQVSEPAVQQLGGSRRSGTHQAVALQQHDIVPGRAERRCTHHAVDPAANDRYPHWENYNLSEPIEPTTEQLPRLPCIAGARIVGSLNAEASS